MDRQTVDALASRVLNNLQRADLDPAGNCFLAARALQILTNDGELVEGRLHGEQHVWFALTLDGEVYHWDPTAHGCGGRALLTGTADLPEAYSEVASWDWPEGYSDEFAEDLVALVRPNGGGL